MFKKKFLKSRVRVTFYLHPTLVRKEIVCVYLVGQFNNWDEQATPMTLSKRKVQVPFHNGEKARTYKVMLDLELDRHYEYRYLITYKDGSKKWHNDWDADSYVPNPYSGDNSVVITEKPIK